MYRLAISVVCAVCALVFPAFCQSPQELSSAASAALKSKNYRQAEELYRHLIQAIPDSGELYSNLGLALYSQQKIDPAETAFRKALALDPKLFVPHYILGRIYFERSQHRNALPHLEAAWRAQPQADVLRMLATTLVALQRPREAIAEYQAFLRENPSHIEAHYGLGLVYLDLGRKAIDRLATFKDSAFVDLIRAEYYSDRPEWDAVAESNYLKAISRSPATPGLRWRLGWFLLKHGEWDRAAQVLREELEIDPASAEARFGLAAVALHRGDLDLTLRQLDDAARLRPSFFAVPRPFPCGCKLSELPGIAPKLEQAARQGSFAAAYLLSEWAGTTAWTEAASRLPGGISGASGKTARPALKGSDLARELFASGQIEELIRFFPIDNSSSPEVLYLLANAYKQLAVATLERMTELNPESARAHELLGDSLATQGLYADAAKAYENAARLTPDDTELLHALGSAHFRAGEFESAIAVFRRIVAVDPSAAEAYSMLGNAELRLDDPAAAIPHLEKALQLNAALYSARVGLGKALARENRPREAIVQLEIAAGSDEDGSVHYELAQMYRNARNEEKASHAMQEFRRLREEKQKREKVVFYNADPGGVEKPH